MTIMKQILNKWKQKELSFSSSKKIYAWERCLKTVEIDLMSTREKNQESEGKVGLACETTGEPDNRVECMRN